VPVKPAELPPADLPLTAFIPEDYVPDENARVSLYYRLTRVERREQAADIRQEFSDRFGKPAAPVEKPVLRD